MRSTSPLQSWRAHGIRSCPSMLRGRWPNASAEASSSCTTAATCPNSNLRRLSAPRSLGSSPALGPARSKFRALRCACTCFLLPVRMRGDPIKFWLASKRHIAGTSGTNQAPFATTSTELVGFADSVVKLSSDLTSLLGSNDPGYTFGGNSVDLDLSGAPALAQTLTCGSMLAEEGKSGDLYIYQSAYQSANIGAGPLARFPAYSPLSGYLYASVNSQMSGGLFPPGLAAISLCGRTPAVVWHAAFDSDTHALPTIETRSVPTPTAGGVFLGTACQADANGGCSGSRTEGGAVWAVDGTTGTVLGGGRSRSYGAGWSMGSGCSSWTMRAPCPA